MRTRSLNNFIAIAIKLDNNCWRVTVEKIANTNEITRPEHIFTETRHIADIDLISLMDNMLSDAEPYVNDMACLQNDGS